jgi:hypothetical protein
MQLHQALTDLEETLASASPGDVGAVFLDEQGKLVIPPLSAEDIPAEAKALRDELASMLPFVPIVSLLIELLPSSPPAPLTFRRSAGPVHGKSARAGRKPTRASNQHTCTDAYLTVR